MDDAQAFECSLRQESANAYQRRYRPCSEEQNIAASPMTQHLWSHLDDLRGPFSDRAFRLLRGNRFVFKVPRHKSSNLCALVDQPTIMLRSVSQPSTRTSITWGTTKR